MSIEKLGVEAGISNSELRRLRQVIEQDWPGINDSVARLESRLTKAGVKNCSNMVRSSMDEALGRYHDGVYSSKGLSKLYDPVRLAVFCSAFMDSFIRAISQHELVCQQDKFVPGRQRESDFRNNLYFLFLDEPLRKTLNETGYEQEILAGKHIGLLFTVIGHRNPNPDGVGIKGD